MDRFVSFSIIQSPIKTDPDFAVLKFSGGPPYEVSYVLSFAFYLRETETYVNLRT